MIGGQLPNHAIDGKDIRPLMFGHEGARSPHEAFFCFYKGGELHAVRNRRFKLHFPHSFRTLADRPGGRDGQPANYSQAKIGNELFDLKNDIGETTDVSAQHPEVVAELERLAKLGRVELGDKLQKIKGRGVRKIGKLESN